MTERCVNLTQAEAKAWAAGATVLIRPYTPKDPDEPSVTDIKWWRSRVLIGREAWHTDVLPISDAIARHEDVMSGGGSWPAIFYRADPANDDAGCIWRSPATMPKAIARHRRRVIDVRVCRVMDLAESEWRAAGFGSWEDACGATTNIGKGWISVTTTEAA